MYIVHGHLCVSVCVPVPHGKLLPVLLVMVWLSVDVLWQGIQWRVQHSPPLPQSTSHHQASMSHHIASDKLDTGMLSLN